MPWRIYIFHFRCYHRIHPSSPIECYTGTIDVENEDYDLALKDAKKEFRRQNSHLDTVEDDKIELMDWEHG